MFVFDDSATSRKRQIAGLAVLLVTVAGGVGLGCYERFASPPDDLGGPIRVYPCLSAGGPDDPFGETEAARREARICKRRVDGDKKGRPNTPPARPGTEQQADRLHEALESAVCEYDRGARCDHLKPPRPATRYDVDLVRTVLQAQGFADAEVRLAVGGDPAPENSVVYAARLPGDTCLVGYTEMGSGADDPFLAGVLPHGGCLR